MYDYDHKFGNGSKANLQGVLPALVEVAELAIRLCAFDGTVIAGGGLRTQAQADTNVANGTGIKHSRHIKQIDGFGHAIDLIPLTPSVGIDWNNLAAFKAMAVAVKTASARCNVPIRQGCDWNMNGVFSEAREYDWAHFEDPSAVHFDSAREEMQRYLGTLVEIPEGTVPKFGGVLCPHCAKPIALAKG